MHACFHKEKRFLERYLEIYLEIYGFFFFFFYVWTCSTFPNLQGPTDKGQEIGKCPRSDLNPCCVSHTHTHVTSCATALMLFHTNQRLCTETVTKTGEVQKSLFPCTVPRSPPQRPAIVNLIKPSNITFCLLLQPAEIGQKPAGNSLIRPHQHTLLPFLHG